MRRALLLLLMLLVLPLLSFSQARREDIHTDFVLYPKRVLLEKDLRERVIAKTFAMPLDSNTEYRYESACNAVSQFLFRSAAVEQGGDAILHLVQGDGRIGAALVAHPDIAGVVFTGSTEVARSINRTLAAKDGPIVPLIAETGGINAMIVDATALPEQVADDVVISAFRSAGQRCSALRLLFLQDDVADRMIEMIAGAACELRIGDPGDPATHIGPVIDAEAKGRLDAHIARMKTEARVHFAGSAPDGNFVAPHIFELADAGQLTEEVFGPVLHLVRYRADRLAQVLQSIERSGYGLTLGIHSRIDDTVEDVIDALQVGNIYVNRNMIGAVVGVQPFGGHGLSGTGPKAGGPHYLARFATEQTVTINTAAAGGNAALLSGTESAGWRLGVPSPRWRGQGG